MWYTVTVISPVSSISARLFIPASTPSRPRGNEGPAEIDRTAASGEASEIAGRESREGEAEKEKSRTVSPYLAAIDPRESRSIVARNEKETEESDSPNVEPATPEKIAEKRRKEREDEAVSRKRDAESSLAGLYGERNALNRKQSEEQAKRSMEMVAALSKLETRDAEVRAHEAAHVAAGGAYVTGGASYAYQKGPDGRQYAIGGEVGIDSAPVSGNPEATIAKMRVVRAAALAPAEPSGADLSVASAASQAETGARRELAERRREELKAKYEPGAETGANVNLVA